MIKDCYAGKIDYIVTKVPRFTFEKFAGSDNILTSSMKSVGEAMAIGRTFKESFQKALRSLEIGCRGFGGGGKFGGRECPSIEKIRKGLIRPTAERVFYIRYAMLAGMSDDEIHEATSIDIWFLRQLRGIIEIETELSHKGLLNLDEDLLRRAKEAGFTDLQISEICGTKIRNIKQLRREFGINTVYRLVDTCAAEFKAVTPYYYSTYGAECEIMPSDKKKIMIIGGGPNRIGQGIEFDYCCVHASFALREAGYETLMINSNPETVSTDYDTSDRLFFEPLTLEDVLEVYKQEKCDGAIVQFGGQTPLNLASELKANGVNIIGTSPESIDAAEDREIFKHILEKLKLKQPVNATATTPEQAYELAGQIGFPILLRPSFVLGGRGMFIVYEMEDMKRVIRDAFDAAPGKPVLLDKFLEDAIELDVDAICDGENLDVSRVKNFTGFDYGAKGVNTKQMDGWNSVYIHDPQKLSAADARKIAERAGVRFYVDENVPVYANEKLLCIHVKDGGKKTVRLDGKYEKVVELYSGKVVAENADSFVYEFNSPDTALFELQK